MENDFFVPVIGIVGYDGMSPSKNDVFFRLFLGKLGFGGIHTMFCSTMTRAKKFVANAFKIEKSSLEDERFLKTPVDERCTLTPMTFGEVIVRRYKFYSSDDVSKDLRKNKTFKGVMIFSDVRKKEEAEVIREHGGIIVHVNGIQVRRNFYEEEIDVPILDGDFYIKYDSENDVTAFIYKHIRPYVKNKLQTFYFARELKLV